MQIKIGQSIVELVQGDITQEDTEAIANAANSGLRGGGGVDGAIHKAAGPSLMQELRRRYNSCPTGSAVITTGGKLKATYVLHAVGPVYRGGENDAKLLAGAYYTCLKLCTDNHIKSVAFPSISTGIYGYPVEEASRIALKTIIDYLREHPEIELVKMVLFSERDYTIYKSALEEIL
ncbi:MAG: macro domain-containing protein [bacterium]